MKKKAKARDTQSPAGSRRPGREGRRTSSPRTENENAGKPNAVAIRDSLGEEDDRRIEEVLKRLGAFRLWLYEQSREHPEHFGMDDAISGFLVPLFKARYLFSAIQKSRLRKISGALKLMKPPMSRSTAYKIIKNDLGFTVPDDFRDCRTMIEIINRGDVLREKFLVLDAEYAQLSKEWPGADGKTLGQILGINSRGGRSEPGSVAGPRIPEAALEMV